MLDVTWESPNSEFIPLDGYFQEVCIGSGELSPQANAARAEIMNIINNFFYEKLAGVPFIEKYLKS